MGSEDINENVNEYIVLLYKGGGSGGVQGPGLRCIKFKFKWKWKLEMEIDINQGTEVTGAALVVMTMTKAATLISFFCQGQKLFRIVLLLLWL